MMSKTYYFMFEDDCFDRENQRSNIARKKRQYNKTVYNMNSAVEELICDDRLKAVKVRNVKSEELREIECDAVFVSIGRNPESSLVKGQLELDDVGYIVADESTVTKIPGVYAVGDVRTKALRQVVTAVADGAVAAHYAEEYLNH